MKLPRRRYIVLVLSLLTVAALAFGHWLVASVVGLNAIFLASDRLRAEGVLLAAWLMVWANAKLDGDETFYWYFKDIKLGETNLPVPVFGSIKGKFWLSVWRPLTLETFHEFAKAVRANNIWRNER